MYKSLFLCIKPIDQENEEDVEKKNESYILYRPYRSFYNDWMSK